MRIGSEGRRAHSPLTAGLPGSPSPAHPGSQSLLLPVGSGCRAQPRDFFPTGIVFYPFCQTGCSRTPGSCRTTLLTSLIERRGPRALCDLWFTLPPLQPPTLSSVLCAPLPQILQEELCSLPPAPARLGRGQKEFYFLSWPFCASSPLGRSGKQFPWP